MGPLIAGMINGIVIPVVMPMLNEWAADLWVSTQANPTTSCFPEIF